MSKMVIRHSSDLPSVNTLIGISCFNNFRSVANLLQSIKKFADPSVPYNIVVCDDGSNETYKLGLREIIKKWNGEVWLVEHVQNYGISATWNTLANYCHYKQMVILNDDILVAKDWLKAIIYFFRLNNKIGSVGLPNYHGLNPATAKKLPYDGIADINRPIFTLNPPGCCFAFNYQTWRTVGPFNEDMKSFYEECDWGTRALSMGFRNYTLPYPWIYHEWSGCFSKNAAILKPSERMNASREIYKKIWGGDLRETFNRFVMKEQLYKIKWLDEKGEQSGLPAKPDLDRCTDL